MGRLPGEVTEMGSLHCRGVVARRDTAHRKLKLIVMNQRFGDKRMHKGPREWGSWNLKGM